ncbi:MAG: hypothetical protein COV52_08850 [Gammaproteobacteria bacterium CG11_big_fil_rev_8_21_14_0_20_46_22]|nr:MAG: hypothetical protein COW05_01465 [Gammaproteobacteria bacterium CG12_big_fil_rev_8_21_14_0_65_46_12]PIR10388.1 MAG: hypothetical protein COV52_08850 [Gammaproteobacteria bacterium CG11_big_fil_rev_8_21_14_0_20_46_22]
MSAFECYCLAHVPSLSLTALYRRLRYMGYEIDVCFVDAHEAVCDIHSITFDKHRRVLIRSYRKLSRQCLEASLDYDVLVSSEQCIWQGMVSDESLFALAQFERKLSVVKNCSRETLAQRLSELFSARFASVSSFHLVSYDHSGSAWQFPDFLLGSWRLSPWLSLKVSLQACREPGVFVRPIFCKALLKSLGVLFPFVREWVFEVSFSSTCAWRLGESAGVLSGAPGFFVQKINAFQA